MRVKLEQASKAIMWKPTRQMNGEGRADGEEPGAGERPQRITISTDRTTGVVSTACKEGNTASVGEARDGRGIASPERSRKEDGPCGRRKGSEVPRKPCNAGGGKGPYFGRACTAGKEKVIGDESDNTS